MSARLETSHLLVVLWLIIGTAHPILTSIPKASPRSHVQLIHYVHASSCPRCSYYRIHTWDFRELYACLFHLHQWSTLLIYWLCTQFKRLCSFLVPLLLSRLAARVLPPKFKNSFFHFCAVRFDSVMSLINEVLRRLYTSSRNHSSFTSAPTALTRTRTLAATCLSVTWIWVFFLVFIVFFYLIIYRISFAVLFDARFPLWVRVSSCREWLIHSPSYASMIKTLFILMFLSFYIWRKNLDNSEWHKLKSV